MGALESPCACSGTQRYAHHACIQRWVTEKGNAVCEICVSAMEGMEGAWRGGRVECARCAQALARTQCSRQDTQPCSSCMC